MENVEYFQAIYKVKIYITDTECFKCIVMLLVAKRRSDVRVHFIVCSVA
jgi:hypothetical protein